MSVKGSFDSSEPKKNLRIYYKPATLEILRRFAARSPHKGAFYTLSYGRFMEQYRLWVTHLPQVKPYYAVKCNPDPVLLRWLMGRDAAFDCASAREMQLVMEQLGKPPLGDKVLFANPCKTPKDIEVGKALQVPWVTADSVEELEKMDRAGYRPQVLVRVAVDDRGSACPFGAKFGLPPEEVIEVVKAAKSFRIPVVGLSFHVGSGSKDPRAFREAVNTTKQVWNDLWKKGEVETFKALDLGGGWSPEASLFTEQARHAVEALKEGPLPQKVIAEPGRFFAAPTHDLYVRVIGKKPGVGGKGWRYTLDESIYGQFSCIPWDHAMPRMARIREAGDDTVRPVTAATLFGRTCDSLDWIGSATAMEELEVGDWLYVPNMGAYTTATSTEFNGFPKPEVVLMGETPAASALKWLETIQYPLAKALSVPA